MEYISGCEPAKTSENIIIIPNLEGLEKAGTPSEGKGQKLIDNWEKSKNND